MTEEDMFFTHTIVGSALSWPMGNIPGRTPSAQAGLRVNMRDASTSLDQTWKDWVILQGAYPYVGRPRRKPGGVRRVLERYALLIAALGLFLCASAIAVMVYAAQLSVFSQ